MSPALLPEVVQFAPTDRLLILNSATDPFVVFAAQQLTTGTLTLAEDNVTTFATFKAFPFSPRMRSVPFHDFLLRHPEQNTDVAVMNLLYQPSNSWIHYGLQVAAHALKVQGRLYVTGAKDRGILTIAKRMQELFGNVETLEISKGSRVVCSQKTVHTVMTAPQDVTLFAEGRLDEGTRLLLEAIEVNVSDDALDIGCGSGAIGITLARRATKGYVTMVDASLAAVEAAQRAVEQSGLTNVAILASDGAQAVLAQRFDLVVTNPPFHHGGVQTLATAERFIREAAQVLRPRGRFYLVANRFLKYEPMLQASFTSVSEIGGDSRFKVLKGMC